MDIRPQQQTTRDVGRQISPLTVGADDVPFEKNSRYEYWDITTLPPELVEKILSYQSVRDVSVCRLVSRRWKSFIDDFHLQARSFYRRCYPDVPFTCRQEIGDRDYRATCQWLQHLAGGTRVGSRSLEQLDLLKTKADPYFCQELCWAISVGLAQAKLDQPRQIYTTKHPCRVRLFDLSAGRNHVVSISHQYLQFCDLSACQATISIVGNVGGQWQQQARIIKPGYVRSFGFGPDEKDCVVVVCRGGTTTDSYSVLVWHSSNGEWQQHLQMNYTGDDYVATAKLTPCGQYLAIAGSSLEIYHRTGEQWQKQDVMPQVEFADGVVFGADKYEFLVVCAGNTFRLFHRVGEQWLAQGFTGNCALGKRPVFSPDGHYFAAVYRGIITIWAYQHKSWERQRRVKGSGVVRSLNFHSEGRLIVSYWGASSELWDLTDGEQGKRLVFPCRAVTNIRISPDHQHFAWYEPPHRVIIWALSGGGLRKQGTIEHSDTVLDICFSPDGQLLATASADKTAKVIRRIGALWREQQSIAHPSGVYGVRFSPAGDYLITTDADGSVNLWRPHGCTEN